MRGCSALKSLCSLLQCAIPKATRRATIMPLLDRGIPKTMGSLGRRSLGARLLPDRSAGGAVELCEHAPRLHAGVLRRFPPRPGCGARRAGCGKGVKAATRERSTSGRTLHTL